MAKFRQKISTQKKNVFLGPLFIIGMPRSGTKLLRELINKHPLVAIPQIETEFIPYWARHWDDFGDLSDFVEFGKFYLKMLSLPYFIYMRDLGNIIEKEFWFKKCDNFNLNGIFEALIRHDAGVGYGTKVIWGDKSPSYINHIPLLKKNFPEAKFIHIVRDVRDYCLSINHAWGKNMFRAAQRWTDNVQKCKKDSQNIKGDFLEIKYENLLTSTENELRKICYFLKIPFHHEMLSLTKPTENIGAAKGETKVMTTNMSKYLRLMDKKTRYKIECIAAPVLSLCGYPVDHHENIHKLSNYSMLFYQIIDGINLVKSQIGQRSIIGAMKFYVKYFIVSGNICKFR